MTARFTIGIEEEFQMVDRHTGHLCPRIETILDKGHPIFGEQIKPELLQSTVEINSVILPDLPIARRTLQTTRASLAQILAEEDLALLSAGTHPTDLWQQEQLSPFERYAQLEADFQDVIRALMIFGLHVHIGVESQQLAVELMNQARTWLPHLLALSSNSPFWAGRLTGIKSYRSVVWRTCTRTGIPDAFASWWDFDTYVQTMVKAGCIDNGKKIWWDMRPHPFYPTIEFRICDMPATIEDTLAIAALCQALIAKLTWLNTHGLTMPVIATRLIEENKWQAMRAGLDAEVFDFAQDRRLTMRQSISELLDFVDDVLDDLGSRRETDFIRALLDSPRGTGADRQIAIYEQTGSMDAVNRFLMQQTMQGVEMKLPALAGAN